MDRTAYIFEQFNKAGLELDDVKIRQYLEYFDLLVERNKEMNLTAITEFSEVVTKHFLDSVIPFTENVSRETFLGSAGKEGLKVIDVGTGAGFPGLPLKIFYPKIRLTLLDALEKRTKFLGEVAAKLGLSDTLIIHARAEEGARDSSLRETNDICVSRAVASLPVLCEYCMPFVRVGGFFVAYKAGDCEEELASAANAVKILGGEVFSHTKLILPGTDIVRSLIFIRKIYATPDKYPRRAGKPDKSPL